MLMIQDRSRRYTTLHKGPSRILPRPRQNRRQTWKRPRVLRLLGVQRRTETGLPSTATTCTTSHARRNKAPDCLKTSGPRQRRRLRQLHLCLMPKRCKETTTPSTTPLPSQNTHLVLGTLRTLMQNPVPQNLVEPYVKVWHNMRSINLTTEGNLYSMLRIINYNQYLLSFINFMLSLLPLISRTTILRRHYNLHCHYIPFYCYILIVIHSHNTINTTTTVYYSNLNTL